MIHLSPELTHHGCDENSNVTLNIDGFQVADYRVMKLLLLVSKLSNFPYVAAKTFTCYNQISDSRSMELVSRCFLLVRDKLQLELADQKFSAGRNILFIGSICLLRVDSN
ncbi:hypothetical protein Tco_0412843 [Tanacetum coccineum]